MYFLAVQDRKLKTTHPLETDVEDPRIRLVLLVPHMLSSSFSLASRKSCTKLYPAIHTQNEKEKKSKLLTKSSNKCNSSKHTYHLVVPMGRRRQGMVQMVFLHHPIRFGALWLFSGVKNKSSFGP